MFQARTAKMLVSALSFCSATACTALRHMDGVEVLRAAQRNSRELMQAGEVAETPIIEHAKDYEELMYALENSAQDIELHGHIDLRDAEGGVGEDGTSLPSIIDHMRSLRVRFHSSMRCRTIPPSSGLQATVTRFFRSLSTHVLPDLAPSSPSVERTPFHYPSCTRTLSTGKCLPCGGKWVRGLACRATVMRTRPELPRYRRCTQLSSSQGSAYW